ncbi:NAD-binding protein [Oscillatoria sp. CS-180]|uniref:potassium channel family protein n=1 Tax=Oscillatoria sp. CS-180 TaxID=3021720 RepID=UPI002330A37E|nr:NAD-binding protein [Oscillatoria sp. CS-180]MDB9525777.1 NAD-binding protein [Oscillatoria sp. CS-180]
MHSAEFLDPLKNNVMYLIVIGAEVEGRRFIEMAVEQGHEITLIESSEEKARQILKENDIRVLHGDIADNDIFKEAEAARADAVVASSYDDSKNLMAMVLAQEYDVQARISLINQKSHSKMFEKLGVKALSDPAGVVASRLLEFLR